MIVGAVIIELEEYRAAVGPLFCRCCGTPLAPEEIDQLCGECHDE
jgi:hypothetical protein